MDGDGNIWFVAKEVCDILGIDPTAVRRLDDDEKNTLRLTHGTAGNPNKIIINEAGLYNLVMNSRKPGAKKFKRWITHEVLPAIRKTGRYVKPEFDTPEDQVDNLAKQCLITNARNRRLKKENTTLADVNFEWSEKYAVCPK